MRVDAGGHEALGFLAAVVAYGFIRRLAVHPLTGGWAFVTVGLLADCLDELQSSTGIYDLVEGLGKVTGYPLLAVGFFISYRAVQAELTRSERTKGALRAEEHRFRVLFQEAPLGYHEAALDGTILRANQAMAHIEFIVVLPEVGETSNMEHVARRILDRVSAPVELDQYEVSVSASIGITAYPDDGIDAESLFRNADAAMYQAKERGRNTYRFYTPALNRASERRLQLEMDLRSALERRTLELHYQPLYDLGAGDLVGAEALLRWTHPVHGPVPPSEFPATSRPAAWSRWSGARWSPPDCRPTRSNSK